MFERDAFEHSLGRIWKNWIKFSPWFKKDLNRCFSCLEVPALGQTADVRRACSAFLGVLSHQELKIVRVVWPEKAHESKSLLGPCPEKEIFGKPLGTSSNS